MIVMKDRDGDGPDKVTLCNAYCKRKPHVGDVESLLGTPILHAKKAKGVKGKGKQIRQEGTSSVKVCGLLIRLRNALLLNTPVADAFRRFLVCRRKESYQ